MHEDEGVKPIREVIITRIDSTDTYTSGVLGKSIDLTPLSIETLRNNSRWASKNLKVK